MNSPLGDRVAQRLLCKLKEISNKKNKKAKMKKTIPKNLESVYEKVKSEVILLHGWWITCRQLYGTSKERIELLNECAGFFFYLVQNALMDGIQLMLTKLSDSARTFGKKNMSLELICEVVNELGEEKLYSNLNKSLSRYRELCSPFKEHRDKRITHYDFETFVNKKSEPLPGISRAMVEEALKELRFFMNQIDGYYLDTEMGYEYFKTPSGGDALIEILKRGLRYEELCIDRKIDIMDIQNSKYYKV